jgi:hypothetical protein
MSRTHKDSIQQNYDSHKDAPYWKYRWWLKHGSKRHSADIRRRHNRCFRAKVKQALHHGRELPKWVRDLPWIYW